MYTLHTQRKKVLNLLILFVLVSNLIHAQQFSLANNESTLTVLGTSNIHDWHLDTKNQSGLIVFKDLESCLIESLTLNVVAESLESGKSGMDKNTFKALNTDDYKTISFQLVEVTSLTDKGDNVYEAKTSGDLTISGTKKRISLNLNINVFESSVKLTGEKIIKMTDFGVEPPKALFGTITTGDEISIKFSTIFK
jgi:polyisoprenoid-binding protein YceI